MFFTDPYHDMTTSLIRRSGNDDSNWETETELEYDHPY